MKTSFSRVRALLTGVAFLTVGLVAVPAALADTTIGQTGTPFGGLWDGGQEIVSLGATVPSGGGTITSFHTQAAADCGLWVGVYDFQILEPQGNDQYRVIGDTTNQTDPCDGQLHSYLPVSPIPVKEGDVLGVYVVSDWSGALLPFSPQAGGRIPEPQVGDVITLPPGGNFFSVDESATMVPYTDTINGPYTAPLTVGAGENALISATAVVSGPVKVLSGGSLTVESAEITGPLMTGTGAASIQMCGSTITGPVIITGDTGQVTLGDSGSCTGNNINGPVKITDGTGTGVTFYNNTVTGPLTITHNQGTIDVGTNTVTGKTITTPNP